MAGDLKLRWDKKEWAKHQKIVRGEICEARFSVGAQAKAWTLSESSSVAEKQIVGTQASKSFSIYVFTLVVEFHCIFDFLWSVD